MAGTPGYDAPAGQIWVCGLTGMTQRNKFGDGPGGRYSQGWNVGSWLNALLCYEPAHLGPNAVASDVQTVHPPDRGLDPLRRVLAARDVERQLRSSGSAQYHG